MKCRFSCALRKRAINVVEDESLDGDDKRKCTESDATLDHLAKTVADLGGSLLQFHNTGSSTNKRFPSPHSIANL